MSAEERAQATIDALIAGKKLREKAEKEAAKPKAAKPKAAKPKKQPAPVEAVSETE